MIKTTGKISIGRTIGGNTDDSIRIEIRDGVSGNRLCQLQLSLRDYALALTGLSEVEGEMQFYEQCPVGKVSQIKTVEMKVCSKHKITEFDVEKHFECSSNFADNWSILNNGIYRQQPKIDIHQYTLIRYVDPSQPTNQ